MAPGNRTPLFNFMNNILLNELIKDEKRNNKTLYSSGPYWDYKNRKTIYQLRKKKLKNFRNLYSGVGTSFCDNLIYDVRNEYNLKGRIISLFYSLPIIKKIYEGQLQVTSDHISNYLKNLSIVFNNNERVNYLLNKYKFENTTEFGCIQKFKKESKEYSTQYLSMAHRVDLLSKKFLFNKIKTYVEIGGGFGSNIHFLLTNFKNIRKVVYIDVVPNIFIGTEYLRFFFKEHIRDYLDTKITKEITFENNDKLEIICIPPWEIEKLKIEIDHFHNASSFVEMPKNVVENYVKQLKKNNLKEISLISYSGYDLKTTYKPELLNDFFDNRLDMEWHSNIIKEYNKKSLYLTSKKRI